MLRSKARPPRRELTLEAVCRNGCREPLLVAAGGTAAATLQVGHLHPHTSDLRIVYRIHTTMCAAPHQSRKHTRSWSTLTERTEALSMTSSMYVCPWQRRCSNGPRIFVLSTV